MTSAEATVAVGCRQDEPGHVAPGQRRTAAAPRGVGGDECRRWGEAKASVTSAEATMTSAGVLDGLCRRKMAWRD